MRYSTFRHAMLSGETLVFGHRGAMASAPMNTLASFQLASEQGADGIELDVHLSRDRQLIVLHDFTVDATTDGQGAAADYTVEELKRLDAGSWFSPKFIGEQIPTLDEVFDSFGSKLLMNVEIKSLCPEVSMLTQAIADCINRHKIGDRTLISSFDAQLLGRIRALCPEIMIGFLYSQSHELGAMDAVAHEARHPRHELIDEAYMAAARVAGKHVNAWTVNDPQRACELCRLGINGLITDHPAQIISALAKC